MTESQVVSPVELALMRGDARPLSPADRVALLRQLAADAGMFWAGSPPVILVTGDGGRLAPYITKAGADMLAAKRGASVLELTIADAGAGIVDVTAVAIADDGRRNVDTGSCEYVVEQPKTRARARMIAATRARRRVLLGLLGSGFAWSEAGDREAGLEDPEDGDPGANL